MVDSILARALALTTLSLSVSACINGSGKPPPLDRAAFPSGLAISPDGDHLVVLSSNFNFEFDGGAALVADVGAIGDKLTGPDVVIDAPYDGGVIIPTFADRPIFNSAGTHVFLTSREQNLLHELPFNGSALSCGDEARCDQAPHALALTGNDPFDVLLLEDTDGGARGLVTHQSTGDAQIFRFNDDSNGNDRLQVEGASLNFGADAFGVRSAVHRLARNGTPARVFATVERRDSGVVIGIDLVAFDVPAPGRAGDVVFNRVDLTTTFGIRSARDIVVVDDPITGGDAVIVALRFPDAIARFSVDASGAMTATALTDTCATPISLEAFSIADVGSGVLVTCQDASAVQMLDPVTLQVTDVSRFYGRGPYDVVVDAPHRRAFVSYFLDNSIGVFSLTETVNGTTTLRLQPIGRLGQALPRPEDGRE